MSKAFAGLSRVGYSDTQAGAVTWITGQVSADSSLNVETTTSETTTGEVYGGTNINAELTFMSQADFDTLQTFSTNDDEKFWHLDFFDGRELVSVVPINPMIVDNLLTNARDGVSGMTVRLVKFHNAPIFASK